MSATTASTSLPAIAAPARGADAAAESPARARLAGWRLPVAALLASLLSSGLCLLGAALFLPARGRLVVQGAVLTGHFRLMQELMSWDASWYQAIAAHGYAWDPSSPAQQTPAF